MLFCLVVEVTIPNPSISLSSENFAQIFGIVKISHFARIAKFLL